MPDRIVHCDVMIAHSFVVDVDDDEDAVSRVRSMTMAEIDDALTRYVLAGERLDVIELHIIEIESQGNYHDRLQANGSK